MESATLVALLRSSTITDPAIEKALGVSGPEGRKFVNVDAQVTGNRFVQLTVAVRPNAPNAKPGLTKVVTAELCERLRAAVEQSSKAATAGFDARKASLEADLAAAKDRQKKAQDDLKAARAANPDPSGGSNVRYNYQNLLQQKQQTEMQLVGVRARLKVLNEQQQQQPQTPTTAPAGPPTQSWSRLIELRQKRLDDLKSASASATEIADAEISLAEIRAFAEAIGALTQRQPAMYGGNYAGSSGELTSLRATVAENEARLAALNEQLSKLTPPTSDDYVSQEQLSRLQNEESRARNEVDSIQNQLNEMRRNYRLGPPPTLTVLDGKAKP
jgi:hypothetical protein